MLEDHGPQPGRLRDLEQLVPALAAVQPGEGRGEVGLRRQPLLLHDDGQAEVDRDDQHAERPRVLGDEVLEGGHHPVAGPALRLGIPVVRVEALAGVQPFHARVDAGLGVGLAELGGDPLGGVVEVAPPVGPQDVVEDEHRQAGAVAAGALGQEP